METQRIDEAQLVRLLDGWCIDISTPLHRQLATALTSLISSGELPPGVLMPSERGLAQALAVSRGTLVAAYTALRSSGMLDSRQGSGTRVRGAQRPLKAAPTGRMSTFTTPVAQRIDLSSAALAGQDWVADVIASVTADDLRPWVRGHGYQPAGTAALRTALAAQCTVDGLPTEQDEIVVTSGSQQALQLIASTLLAPGDEVVVEDPTYRGALEAFRARGARLRTVPHREDGVDVDVLVRLVRSRRPRLLYLLPAVHNPVGITLRPAVARAIAEVVAETGTTLVEDRSTVDTLFRGPAPIPLAALAPEASVLTVGSLSKLFWGGLRIGWVRGSSEAVRQLAGHRSAADLGSSMPSQLAAERLLTHIDRARRIRAEDLGAAYGRIADLLVECLPDWTWTVPSGGASLWARLPQGDAVGFAETARRAGVVVTPGPVFSATEGQRDRLRLSFAVSPEVVRAGIERLAEVWRGRR